MKLRNKKTGEIAELIEYGQEIVPHEIVEFVIETENNDYKYNSLAELNEEWEDYEEPKEHWFINSISGIETTDRDENDEPGKAMIEIGNYFVTREEAEKAVEKLKALKRLKDNDFRFEVFGYDRETVKNGRVNIMIRATFNEKYGNGSVKLSDLDLLFRGKE